MGLTEILLILGVIILLFGAKKIPELMRGVGKGMREFNDAKGSREEETVVTKRTETVKPTNRTTDPL